MLESFRTLVAYKVRHPVALDYRVFVANNGDITGTSWSRAGYGSAGSITDSCGHVASLIDSDGSSTHVADYIYLGLGTQQDSPQASLRYTLIDLTGSNDPDTGDIYAGLDRFSRIKDLRWRSTSTNSDLSRIRYGYDRASSRNWRENPSDTNRHYDWLYSNDGMHRLHDAQRGQLNARHTAITSPQFGQCWTLDETGNWQNFRQDDDGNGSWDLIQVDDCDPGCMESIRQARQYG